MTEVLDRPVNGHTVAAQVGPHRAVTSVDTGTNTAVDVTPTSTPVVDPVRAKVGLFRRSTGPRPTRRVRKLRAAQAENRQIEALQDDPVWTQAKSPQVIRETNKAANAARLHALQRDPARQALSAARWRRSLTVAVGVGLVAALGWSTANVQHTVAAGAEAWSSRWVLAFLVEPFIALFLLTIFAFKAYMATAGEIVEDRRVDHAERVFLGITLTLNVWPHVPVLKELVDLLASLVAVIGPISAVLAVSVVPVIWAYIADLDHGAAAADPELVEGLELVREWIAAKRLAPTPTRTAIERELRAWVGEGNRFECWPADSKRGIPTKLAQRVHRCLTGRTELL